MELGGIGIGIGIDKMELTHVCLVTLQCIKFIVLSEYCTMIRNPH